ncbi:MAG: manganese catalase family protein [Stellaceae bacterium]
MYIHKKELLHPVVVTQPSASFAQFLLEQFGGATGELSAGLQYFVQAQHTDDPNLRDMLLDISTEEFGHLEIVAHLIEAHTKGSQQAQAYQSALFSVRGKGAHFLDSQGVEWSAKYINEGASPVRDLRADIAAEGGALATYEALLPKAPDEGSFQALRHLATREVAHTKMFMIALQSMNKLDEPPFLATCSPTILLTSISTCRRTAPPTSAARGMRSGHSVMSPTRWRNCRARAGRAVARSVRARAAADGVNGRPFHE